MTQTVTANQQRQYAITVDYRLTLSEMIAAGGYDHFETYITEKLFPSQRHSEDPVVVEVTAELIHLNHYSGRGDVLHEIDRLGYRPATLEELLAFGATYPEVQLEFPIVALGSLWSSRFGRRDIPFLDSYSQSRSNPGGRSPRWRGRSLHLAWDDTGWYEENRFLAVRK